MTATLTYTDAHVVRAIEEMLAGEPTDHMLGCRVRVLFEMRAGWLRGLDDLLAVGLNQVTAECEAPEPPYVCEHGQTGFCTDCFTHGHGVAGG